MNKVLVILIVENCFTEAKNSLNCLNVRKYQKEPLDNTEQGEWVYRMDDCEVEFKILDTIPNNEFYDYAKQEYDIKKCSKDKVYYYINKYINKSKLDFFCIIPSHFFATKNFLLDLLVYYFSVANSGVLGIKSDLSDVEYAPLVCNDIEFVENVMLSNQIRGLCFFSRTLLEAIGYFDVDKRLIDNEIEQYCLRSSLIGFNNYYIDNNVAIYFPKPKDECKYLQESITKMIERKNFYIDFSTY